MKAKLPLSGIILDASTRPERTNERTGEKYPAQSTLMFFVNDEEPSVHTITCTAQQVPELKALALSPGEIVELNTVHIEINAWTMERNGKQTTGIKETLLSIGK